MDNLTPIELLVNEKVYDDIMQKGFAEITQRRKDAKFTEMVKSPIFFEKVTENPTNNLIAQESLKMTNNQNNIRHAINELGLGKASVNELTATTKNMASQVNMLGMTMKSVQSLEYLNASLNFANISVDVAGFAMVLNKLNLMNERLLGLDKEIDGMSDRLSSIAANQWNKEKGNYKRLILDCKSILLNIKLGKNVTTDKIENMLHRLIGFITYIQDSFKENRYDQETLLKMMASLIPPFSFLVSKNIEKRLFEDNVLPPGLQECMDTYAFYNSPVFREKLEDFYILEKGMHINDAMDIVNTWSLFALNGRVQNEDLLSLLKTYNTKELYAAYESKVDDMVKLEIKEKVPIIAERANCDKSDVLKYFQINE